MAHINVMTVSANSREPIFGSPEAAAGLAADGVAAAGAGAAGLASAASLVATMGAAAGFGSFFVDGAVGVDGAHAFSSPRVAIERTLAEPTRRTWRRDTRRVMV